jgi:ATP-binding cassette, subfamily B, multidrug efflux pump
VLKLFRFLKPYRVPIMILIILVFLQSLTELALPTLMADIVQNGILKMNIPTHVTDIHDLSTDQLQEIGITFGNIPYIWNMGAVMLLVALLGGICTILVSFISSRVSTGMGRNMRELLFSQVMRFSLHEMDRFGTSSLITRTTNDIQQTQMVTLMVLRMVIAAPMMAVGGIIMALQKNRSLSSIFLIILPVIALIIFLVARKGIPLFKAMQLKLDHLNLVLRERLTGIRVIRAFSKEPFESLRFERANRDLTDTAVKVHRIMAILLPSMMMILSFTTLAIVWFSAHQIDLGQSNIGDMMAFIQYSMLILMSLIMFSMIFVMIPRAIASAERIHAVLESPLSITDNPLSEEVYFDRKGYLEFSHVTFRYPNAPLPVIRDFSFKVYPGETTAIIGSTGSGKSTLINLILRFYDIDSGEILIDGVSIRDIPLHQLRKRIGFVPQKAVLFSGTIADNLRFGNKNATDDDLINACRTAQAYDFIQEKDLQLEERVSQEGTNLSGGQRQRIAVARALLSSPGIYIFDDSFSALDFKTDRALRMSLKKELQDETIIIVSQRISTVMDADRIIVINDGCMAGMGTHRELLADNEIYREIVASQLAGGQVK